MVIWFEIDYFYRAGFAFLTAFLLMLLLGPTFIALMRKLQARGQPIRDDGPSNHLQKQGTPTLGGILIVFTFIVSTLLWVKQFNHLIFGILGSCVFFFLLGLIDDLKKLISKSSKGLSGKLRLILGFIFSFYIAIYISEDFTSDMVKALYIPFIEKQYYFLGNWYFFFIAFVFVGTANSVNLTDGLDGLATITSGTVLTTLFIALMLVLTPKVYNFANGSPIVYNKLIEVLIIIAAMIGALLGFLWFNSSPAQIFMGDAGSLAIGATIAAVAYAFKHELMLILIGIIFIIETLSVILQVYYYKMTKERIFLMAPLHHHFEKKGYAEIKIVTRFWLITVIFCIICLLLLDVK